MGSFTIAEAAGNLGVLTFLRIIDPIIIRWEERRNFNTILRRNSRDSCGCRYITNDNDTSTIMSASTRSTNQRIALPNIAFVLNQLTLQKKIMSYI
jgi:hypothetical protein